MRSLLARRLFAAGVVLLAACSNDNLGPAEITDPAATLADFQAIGAALSAEQLSGYQAVSAHLSTGGGAVPQVIGRVLALAAPDTSLLRGTTAPNAARAAELRDLIPSFSLSGTQGPIIPAEVAGTTFEWNVESGAYAATARPGAPANGIRFIVYAIDPLTGQPVVPLTETGYADIIDESTAVTARLHVVLSAVGGAPTYLDYRASASANTTGSTLTAAGFVSNGQSGAALRQLDFSVGMTASPTQTGATISFDISFDLNEPDVAIDVALDFALTETSLTQDILFAFQRSGEAIVIDGTIVSSEATGTVFDLDVRVNGGLFATLSGAGAGLTIVDENGDPLTEGEVHLLQELFAGVASILDAAVGLLQPALYLLNVGI